MAASHTIEDLQKILFNFMYANLDKVLHIQTETVSLGYGQWAIDVDAYDAVTDEKYLITRLSGSNGTRSEADDLWTIYDQALERAYQDLREEMKNEGDMNALDNQSYEG